MKDWRYLLAEHRGTLVAVAIFVVMFWVLGLKDSPIVGGDFILYVMSGVFMFLTHTKAMGAVESQADAATSGARDVGRQALGFAEENVAAAFAFAEKLVRARDPQEIMQLQADFAKQTMQKLSEQSKAMGEQVQSAAREATKPKA